MKAKTQNNWSARQGDILIERVSDKSKRKSKPQHQIVLAHGEATGHNHAVAEPERAELIPVDSDARSAATLVVSSATSVVHQEHAPIPLARGTYRVVRQVEYTPGDIKQVSD